MLAPRQPFVAHLEYQSREYATAGMQWAKNVENSARRLFVSLQSAAQKRDVFYVKGVWPS